MENFIIHPLSKLKEHFEFLKALKNQIADPDATSWFEESLEKLIILAVRHIKYLTGYAKREMRKFVGELADYLRRLNLDEGSQFPP